MEERPLADRVLMYPSLQGPLDEKSKIEKILDWFESHAASEIGVIREYEAMGSTTKNEAMRFLIQLIVEEEEKHHRLLQVMTQTLRESLIWRSQADAIHFLRDPNADEEEVKKVTAKFLAQEREGIQACKALKKETRKLYYGLFEALFDVMIRDSEKHEALLKYINKTMKGSHG